MPDQACEVRNALATLDFSYADPNLPARVDGPHEFDRHGHSCAN
jgi:hypothetical protein